MTECFGLTSYCLLFTADGNCFGFLLRVRSELVRDREAYRISMRTGPWAEYLGIPQLPMAGKARRETRRVPRFRGIPGILKQQPAFNTI